MRFFFDNNLSPHLAKAIAALSAPHGIDVVHLRTKFSPETPDIDWIQKLASEGDWRIITQDRLFKGSLEKEALRRSGLAAFVLVKGWVALNEWDKAWQLVRWWPRIIQAAELVTGSAAFAIPVRFSGKGKFEQVKL